MTTKNNSTAAREIAEKHLAHYDCDDIYYACPQSVGGSFSDRAGEPCTCSYGPRVTELAQAIEEYGYACAQSALRWATSVTVSRESLTREARMPLHQEDGE